MRNSLSANADVVPHERMAMEFTAERDELALQSTGYKVTKKFKMQGIEAKGWCEYSGGIRRAPRKNMSS